MRPTATVTVPTEPAAYARWLTGRMHAVAHLISRDERVDLDNDTRAGLVEAARALLAAVDA
ncbi:hypothetical protein [Micromonospora okii]|uniref:hypothetical protein n=1 Tax=Micromonospora okii TaxID=1182970 RepID=UPI001E4BB8B6|nr:hypothetical protein [Micromonospora okii]